MTLLPCFHVIVTCELDKADLRVYRFLLMTFHGKKLAQVNVDIDTNASKRLKNLELLSDLANDNLHICQGVQDLKERRWKNYLSKAKVPVLEKVKHVFFFEPLEEDVILRSRLCTYFVRDPVRNDDPRAMDYVRCEECFKYQKVQSVSLFTYRKGNLPEMEPKLEDTSDMSDDMADNEYLDAAEHMYAEETEEREELKDFVLFNKKIYSRKFKEKEQFESEVKIEPLVKDEVPLQVEEGSSEISCIPLADQGNNLEGQGKRKKRSTAKKVGAYSEESLSLSGGWAEADPMFESHLGFQENESDNDDAVEDKDFVNDTVEEEKEEEHKIKKQPKWPRKVTQVDYALIFRKTSVGLEMLQPDSKGFFVLQKDHEYVYQCGVCKHARNKYEFVMKCSKRHVEEMSLKEPINCPVCDERIVNKGNINEHFFEKHSELKKFCCCECLELFDEELLRKHIIRKHHAAGTKEALCTLCGTSFQHVYKLKQHIVKLHGDSKDHICAHCGKMYATGMDLERHVTIQHSTRDMKCLHCEKSFPNFNRIMLRHLQTHTGKISLQLYVQNCIYLLAFSSN